MTRGIVYYAVRSLEYVKMAERSARSVKRHMPDMPITLFTDLPDCRWVKKPVFDSVKPISPVPKLLCNSTMVSMTDSPYKFFIVLDCDTWVCGNLGEIFDALEHSPLDLMFPTVQQYRHVHKLDSIFEAAGVPAAYPRYAGGVRGIAKNRLTEAFLATWATEYEKLSEKWIRNPVCPNQVPLRIAAHRSPDVNIGVLRDCYDYQLYGFFNRPIKIIHAKGTEEQFRAWEREANKHAMSPRFFEAGHCIRRIRQ